MGSVCLEIESGMHLCRIHNVWYGTVVQVNETKKNHIKGTNLKETTLVLNNKVTKYM